MYEVEVKAKLTDRKAVMQKLESLGCAFSGELLQVDYIFMPAGVAFPPPLGTNVLRVRQQNDSYYFTLKIPQSNPQDCIEKELAITDGEKMIEIVRLLGFYQVPTVKKTRIKTTYQDIEIVLDRVENLGEFIEAEKIVNSEDPADRQNTQNELLSFLLSLGVQNEDQIVGGKYDVMLYKKYGMQVS